MMFNVNDVYHNHTSSPDAMAAAIGQHIVVADQLDGSDSNDDDAGENENRRATMARRLSLRLARKCGLTLLQNGLSQVEFVLGLCSLKLQVYSFKV